MVSVAGVFSLYSLNNASLPSTFTGSSFDNMTRKKAVLGPASSLQKGAYTGTPGVSGDDFASQHLTNKANMIDLSA